MTRCFCGADHAADHHRGVVAERASRVERWGEPFERMDSPLYDGIELRAEQTEGGAWQATVYAAHYEALAMCEVGAVEFTGYAATEARAQAMAQQAAATLIAKWNGWKERWAREREEAMRR